jgi:hypothetical protein
MTDGARYPPIADHGVIGDLQTAALVATDGTIDFLCLPEFDSPTVFARLLDADRGGFFGVAPLMEGAQREQRYLRDTNVLVTRFAGEAADVEITDFMPVARRRSPSKIVRLARVTRGDSLRVRAAVRLRARQARRRRDGRRGDVLLGGYPPSPNDCRVAPTGGPGHHRRAEGERRRAGGIRARADGRGEPRVHS